MRISLFLVFVFSFGALFRANVDAADQVNMTFAYNYTLLADNVDYTLVTGLSTLDTEAEAYLKQQLDDAEISALVLNYTSSLLGSCGSTVPALPACGFSGTELVIQADQTLDEALVERLSLKKLQLFMSDFNTKYDGDLQVGYDAPIFVKAEFNLVLQGVKSAMEAAEQETLIAQLLKELGARLLAESGIGLDDVKIVVQTPQVGSATTRRLSKEEEEEVDVSQRRMQEVSGNRVGMILNGHCGGGTSECFNNKMQEEVDKIGGEYANSGDLLQDLQNANTGGAPDYFDRVGEIDISDVGVLDVNITDLLGRLRIPPAPVAGQNSVDEEPVPWWIWILVGVSCLVLILGGVWTALAVTRRNDDALLRQAYDEHHASDSKRRGLFAHFGSSARRGGQGNDIVSRESPHEDEDLHDEDDGDVASPESQQTGPQLESADDEDEGGLRNASVYDNGGASTKFEDENRDV